MIQTQLSLNSRNPDVLSCIANLSNDAVFTPPELANEMLDMLEKAWSESNNGELIWENSEVTFLDPCTKTGIFLREIVKRLVDGLEKKIPDLQKRVNHILMKQVFGLATETLTGLLARRSVYCSKYANGEHSIAKTFPDENGNIWFERTEHTWVGGNETVLTADEQGNPVEKKKNGKCKYCGASQREYERDETLESHAYAFIHTENIKERMNEIFGEEMKFDVVIGNPPYQLNDGGGSGTSAAPIYQKFVEQAKKLEPRFLALIVPARWYAGGKGLDSFRAEMLGDARLRIIHDFPDSNDVFPGTQIKGGICYFLWDRDNEGEVFISNYGKNGLISSESRGLLEDGADVLIRFNKAIPILNKVFVGEGSKDFRLKEQCRFSNFVSSRRPFGLSSTYRGKEQPFEGSLKTYQAGSITYANIKEVNHGEEMIKKWKVFIPFLASGSDAFPHPILGKAFGKPNDICTESYLTIGPFPDEFEVKNVISYISTRLFRFLVLQRKPSQNATRKVYEFVPIQDFSKPWTDVELYEKYGLDKDEIKFIESMIRPMEIEKVVKSLDELLPEKPKCQPRIYVYTIKDDAHKGQLKIGQTSGDVKKRIGQQLRTANVQNYEFLLDEPAEKEDGTVLTDFEVRARLVEKGFKQELNENGRPSEWVHCELQDVQTAIIEINKGIALTGTHHETFPLREEQKEAVQKTFDYFTSIWEEDKKVVPRFLWNAKMRFGKTFTSYHLAKSLEAKKILVLTFKPAVEDAWETDLKTHSDFNGWQYYSNNTSSDPKDADSKSPLVYFGSFQDLLGKDKATGAIKIKNEWIHTTNWDLVIFDEYHFGAWRENAKELFEGEDENVAKKELAAEYSKILDTFQVERDELGHDEDDFLPITNRAYLYLSGTPFKALATGEFIEEQIFNWTYTDEQSAKRKFSQTHPSEKNPYETLPEMRLFTYQMPDEIVAIANQGEFDEFDLNAFFTAVCKGEKAEFKHKYDVQKWLEIIRGEYQPSQIDSLKSGTRPPFPYSDVRLLPYLSHSFWFLPTVAACDAMANLLAEPQNKYWHEYQIIVAAGTKAGIGLKALPPVRRAIGSGHDTKSITLSCGKLTTGVTVPQWSSILMLRNLNSPETYFQAAFRVQSPWVIRNPNGDDPNEIENLKPVCFVFDFAPTRALRQIAEYGSGLDPEESNPEKAVEKLVEFLPVLAYDGSNMTQVDAGGILDIAMAGTSATLLARKWESAILVNVDNDTLRKIMNDPRAMKAVMNIEGFRALGNNVFETVINKSESVSQTKKEKGESLTPAEKKELSAEEKEYKSKRKQIQEKLIKFATRIPAFMYLTDYRENKLQDVITKIEPGLFKTVTGLTVEDFELLVSLGVFNSTHMNQAVFAFRRYEDASLSYTGIESHEGLRHYGLYDTVVSVSSD